MDMQATNNAHTFFRKIGGFFKKHVALFYAPILVLAVYTATLASYGVWPFGKEYTAASYDLSAQIAPFIEHLFDVFSGKSSLTYSYAIAGGADVVGTFLYFFISPFSFIFLLFGDGMVAHASSIVMGLKVATIAFAGTWFARKLFLHIPDYVCAGIGLVYAYCGYTFVSCTYINWMDFLIYLPFCVAAFVHFAQTHKFLPFAILITCCIYTCFSIACFSMFTVFPVLIVYGLLCVEKMHRNDFFAKLCLAFAVAIIAALPVLVPALKAYLISGRSGEGLFYNFWFGFKDSSLGKLGSFSNKEFLSRWSESLYYKMSYILSDSLFFILTLIWIIRSKLHTRFSWFVFIAGVYTLIPTFVDEAMLLMNMGSYMSYALRFGFLNATYFLCGACLSLNDLFEKHGRLTSSKTTQETTDEGGMYATNCITAVKKPHNIWKIIFIAVGVCAVLFLAWYISFEHYLHLWDFAAKDEELLEGLHCFSSRYAHSLGGLEVIGVLLIVVVVVTTLGYILCVKNKIGIKLLTYVLMVTVGLQVVFYNNQLVLGNRSTQHTELGDLTTITQTLSEIDESYFRLKDYNDKFTANAPFTVGGNSFSVFSSVIDRKNFTILELFGYLGNNSNLLKSSHDYGKLNRSEEFGDSFLGYKYYAVHKDLVHIVANDWYKQKYIKPVMTESENGTSVPMRVGDYFVYENTIVFPFAYRVSGGAFHFTAPNTADSVNRKYNQQALYRYLRGKTLAEMQTQAGSNSSVYVTVETARELSEYLWDKSADIQVGQGTITATTTAEAGEYLFLNFVASDGYQVTVNGKQAKLIENDLHFLCVALEEGENTVVFTYKSPYIKYALYGSAAALTLLCAIAFVQRTKVWQAVTPVVAWSGVALASGVTVFYFLFPTAVWIWKLLHLIF